MILGVEKIQTDFEALFGLHQNAEKIHVIENACSEKINYKIKCDEEIDFKKLTENEEFKNLVMIIKDDSNYYMYFSNPNGETGEELIKRIQKAFNKKESKEEKKSIESEEDKEEAKRLEEEEARIVEEQRLQQLKEENELEVEIKKIFANKEVIREIKEKCEDIEKLIYRLKNQVNFMTFYYLVTENVKINFEKYSEIFDWYMDLSQKYIKCEKINIEYKDISKKGFENQLNKVKNIHDMLYSAWKIFQAEKKFSEEYFKSIEKKIPSELIQKISSEKIFEFGKEEE